MVWKEVFKVEKGIVLAAVVKASHALVWTALEVKGRQKISLHEPVFFVICNNFACIQHRYTNSMMLIQV